MKKTAATILISLLLYFQGFGLASAEIGSFSFTLSRQNTLKPNTMLLSLKPGDSVTENLVLENLAGFTQSFKLYAADETVTRDKTFTVKSESYEMTGVGKWFSFENAEETIGAASKKTVMVSLTVPSETPEGVYKGGIVAKNLGTVAGPGGVVSILKIFVPVEVRVTNTPENIPLQPEALAVAESSPIPVYYFWASIGIFIASMAYFLLAKRKEKHLKKSRE